MSQRTERPGAILGGPEDLEIVDFEKGGGDVVVVAQDADDGTVLMVARADREALLKTLETGTMWYRSRSRGLWHKGDTSGNVQRVVTLRVDCDGDSVLAQVRPDGPACHTGEVSCFGAYPPDSLARLDAVIEQRASRANSTGYTAKLLNDRNLRLKKIGEEAAEFTVACGDSDTDHATEEAADLVYHTAVALRATGGSLRSVRRALAKRER
ncbi:MAG TPA: bifunctional phosphoribosyl-AMP cyclohydrolase/phosphoribosyl-ATP diphosphatase HisIE [Gemmatimonadaceae bacterium]|nr:bifunctional phosphoribosyl-AMP cyclohydrolase/phosphoribosyl-ATP diphosphatase HisIE [Gemmatimonadaceae bacterium]